MDKKPKKGIASRFFKGHIVKKIVLALLVAFFVVSSAVVLWVATLRIPDLQSFQDKVLSSSTKIYDRTGNILFYDLNQDVKRQTVPFDQISPYLKNATIAIEDEKFYQHKGVEFSSIARAVWVNLQSLSFKQGGSTITQQVIKNALLTTDKKISRKVKEWVLALKLERVMSKDDILNLYLNGSSYGGNVYGVEEASETFFGKPAKDVTLAEAAYIAAVTKAPTHYSPYGNYRQDLVDRKNLVLQKMKDNGFITDAQYSAAKAEKVVFRQYENNNIKAPHFVMFIKDYLEQKYGEEMVKNGDLKVITTLDYDLQSKAQDIVKQYALSNEKNFNAENAGLVAIDPTTGQILAMVGSRDYFDKNIDGNFNITLAHRQPGSSFKPFAYVTAFEKGYTPDTVLFDLPTQFSTACDPYGNPVPPNTSTDKCYMPQNYDHQFRGPMSLRNALSQSINIPSVKVMYLAGINDSIKTAQAMGITSLTDPNQYGLSLALGGGEVSPLEMTSAYGVFANNGVRNPYTGILKITGKDGKTLEEFTPDPTQAIPRQSALLINDVLSDNNARMPLFSAGSAADFSTADRKVALKTGTTNDSRDAWIIGYTPQIVIGAWAGNNDNTPMVKKTSGLIVAPLWRAVLDEALKKLPPVSFDAPDPTDSNLKPVLRGIWQGDPLTGSNGVHTILYWVDKNNPTGSAPASPRSDSQFDLWDAPIQGWAQTNVSGTLAGENLPQLPNNQIVTSTIQVTIQNPIPTNTYNLGDQLVIVPRTNSTLPITKAEFYMNNSLIGTAMDYPFTLTFSPGSIKNIQSSNQLKVVVYDMNGNKAETAILFTVRK